MKANLPHPPNEQWLVGGCRLIWQVQFELSLFGYVNGQLDSQDWFLRKPAQIQGLLIFPFSIPEGYFFHFHGFSFFFCSRRLNAMLISLSGAF